MRGSISIENISFSRKWYNYKCEERHWRFYLVNVYLLETKNSDTLDIAEHGLFNSPIIIRRCGFH